MKPVRAAFIGFGEVAPLFAEALGAHGAEILVHDVLWARPAGRRVLRRRDRTGRVRFLPRPEAMAGADYVFSTVTTDVAEPVARAASAWLVPGQVYLDVNAASPAIKRAIASLVAPTGAHFVEGAILGAVGVSGARTRILIGDERGPGVARALARLGLNAAFYSRQIGRASAFKLLRSVFSKGLEALLIEYLVAGRRAGLQKELWREATELFAENPFEQVAANWIRTHASAHERRSREMTQVAAELRALGLDPLMTAATEKFFARSRTLGLMKAFARGPATPEAVIAAVERRLPRTPPASGSVRPGSLRPFP